MVASSPYRSCLVFKALMIDSFFDHQTILSHSLPNNRLILLQWPFQNSSPMATFLWDKLLATKMSKCVHLFSGILSTCTCPNKCAFHYSTSAGLPVTGWHAWYPSHIKCVLAMPFGTKTFPKSLMTILRCFFVAICGVKPVRRREHWIEYMMKCIVTSDKLLRLTDRYWL